MRILYVHGINQVAHIHGSELTRRGHSVAIDEPSLAGGNALAPIKLAMMPGRVLDMRRIANKLSQNYFDLVHIHWASYGALGLVSRIPFIVECHGSDVRYRLKHPFFRAILTPVFRRAATVLCITPDLLPVVQSVRPDAIFLPGPVDIDRFTPEQDKRQGSSRPWTILLFTRLDPIKGPEVAIQGIARFTERHADVRVRLLDWGLLKEQYKRRFAHRFEFIPPVGPEKVAQMIGSADVVVGQFLLGILSFCELQAMSCAKPVITSFRYDDAYPTPPPLVRATTPGEIDERLEYLFQHQEERLALGRKSREWVIENHDYRVLASKLETLYQSILKPMEKKV